MKRGKQLRVVLYLLLVSAQAISQSYHNPWKIELSGGVSISGLGDDPREPSWEEFLITPYETIPDRWYVVRVNRPSPGYRIQVGPEISASALHEIGLFVGVSMRFSTTIWPSRGYLYYDRLDKGEYRQGEKVVYNFGHANLNIGFDVYRSLWHDRNPHSLVIYSGGGVTFGNKRRGFWYQSEETNPFDVFHSTEEFTVDYNGWNWNLGIRYRWSKKINYHGYGWGFDFCRLDHKLFGYQMKRTMYEYNGEDLMGDLSTSQKEFVMSKASEDDGNPDSPKTLNRERNEAWEWRLVFYVNYNF